MRIIKCNI